ncbi:MAG: hypothetical protein ACRCYY_05310 [Trueperaceae bacterium]
MKLSSPVLSVALCIFSLLCSLSSFSIAQVTCESLVDTITTAFDTASQVIMKTQILQGEREFAYSKLKLYKDRTGEWQSEVLEERGAQRPEDSEGTEDGAEPTFEFNCEGHTLVETENGWDLMILESNEEIPIEQWNVSLLKQNDVIVPSKVTGQFEARVLFIPFRGSFNTEFSDWVLPQ